MFENMTKRWTPSKVARFVQREDKRSYHPVRSVELVYTSSVFCWVRLKGGNGEIITQQELVGIAHGEEMLIRLALQLSVDAFVREHSAARRRTKVFGPRLDQ
jgi:hypothetical protein